MYELINAFGTQKFCSFWKPILIEYYAQWAKNSPITKFHKLFKCL